LYARPLFLNHLKDNFCPTAADAADLVVVSPDAGGVETARAYAKRLHASLAIIDKRRTGPNVAEVMNIIGDVEGKRAIILDDMIDTAGTLTQAAGALKKEGASGIWAYASHAVFSGPAVERLVNSEIKQIVVTDSIPLGENAQKESKFIVLPCAPLVGEAIKRVHSGDSISTLFS